MGESYQDIYFLAYGSDYKRALLDYLRIAGNVPLVPRFMLGNWWSRFWEYSTRCSSR
jgi:alpha-glucosidase (family GH31 glycosyl hydrolase)